MFLKGRSLRYIDWIELLNMKSWMNISVYHTQIDFKRENLERESSSCLEVS